MIELLEKPVNIPCTRKQFVDDNRLNILAELPENHGFLSDARIPDEHTRLSTLTEAKRICKVIAKRPSKKA